MLPSTLLATFERQPLRSSTASRSGLCVGALLLLQGPPHVYTEGVHNGPASDGGWLHQRVMLPGPTSRGRFHTARARCQFLRWLSREHPLKTTPLQKHAWSIQHSMGCRIQDLGPTATGGGKQPTFRTAHGALPYSANPRGAPRESLEGGGGVTPLPPPHCPDSTPKHSHTPNTSPNHISNRQ